MRSIRESASDDDRTTRARVRDVAIEVFARDGFGATVRTIASAAEVSPGLVIHHFGSKAALRDACDAFVLTALFDANRDVLTGTDPYGSIFAKLQQTGADDGVYFVYLLRTVQQGGDAARLFLARMVELTVESLRLGVENGQIRPSLDEAGRARYLTSMSIGALLVDTVAHPPSDWSDATAILRGYIDRVAVAGTELAVHGILTDTTALDAALAARRNSPTTEDGDDESH